jgi:hypothetical protein
MVINRERDQIETEEVSAAWFLRSADFQAGVDNVRAGRPAHFDAYNYDQGDEALTNRLGATKRAGNLRPSFPHPCRFVLTVL